MRANYFKIWYLLFALPAAMFIASCGDDDSTASPSGPIASFQFEKDSVDFRLVRFSNFSQNAVSYAWNFGDDSTSSEENPSHLYAEGGTYQVTLTATSASGATSTKTEEVVISDPDVALTLLTGVESKTWKLYREGISLQWGSAPETNNIWTGLTNNGKRPCLYEQTFTFHRDGRFVFDDQNVFWAEYTPWLGTPISETCFEPTAANMVNADGADVSAWGSGTHQYNYNVAEGTVTLTGMGAWMGFVNVLGNDVYSSVPTATRVLNIAIKEEVGYEVMTILYTNSVDVWTCKYASYANPADEPALVTDFVEPVCDPEVAISPTEISHTFASDAASEWVLLQPSASGAGLELGVNDPVDSTNTKVGKYVRIAGVNFQELQFKLSPINAINFENLNTLTMDVYMPSSNDYSGTLTDNVFIGFGATKCPPLWYEDQHEFQEMDVAKDAWVTITFDLSTAADYVAVPANGATLKDRNDLDMIYIAIGGGGHGVGGEFFIRNLKLN